MTAPIAGVHAPTPAAPSPEEGKLRKTAQQLEGLFVEQLFKAMRETVPQDEGAFGAPQGEDMFTGLMDQRLATETPTQWAHGLADAAYRQLRTALPGAQPEPDAHASHALTHSMSLTPKPSAAQPLRAPEAIPVQRAGPISLNAPVVPAAR